MPLHDSARVAGVSESCRYNDHSDCRAPNCACDCHNPIPEVVDINLEADQPGPEKSCPKCGIKRPFIEVFCRVDGERLASLVCGVCGAGMEPVDGFCWKCSSPKGKVAEIRVGIPARRPDITVPTGDVRSDLPDFGSQIVRHLQEELGQVEGIEGDSNDKPQEVVEKPAGVQGSFTLVNKPNPNKVRTGGPRIPGSPGQGDASPIDSPTPITPPRRIRLPIKPS